LPLDADQASGGRAMPPVPDQQLPLDQQLLAEVERTAVELARLAGAEITTALGRVLAVRYKGAAAGEAPPTDPVSEVDHAVEVLIRARLGDRFPDHGIVGEEIDEEPDAGGRADLVWVVDPVDGTLNFVNGFPLFAASVGVLHRGRPVAGAVWCSTSHALRAGTYHAREGCPLRFEGEPLPERHNPSVQRHLGGEPGTAPAGRYPYDIRVTGSAAIECAFVAAGLLRVARFERPNIWDVGGGLPLLRAAGCEVRGRSPGGSAWAPLERFEGEGRGLRYWTQAMILGQRDAVDLVCRANT
jgi:myo-inositol-1(or 4)-monophosphatase